MTLFDAAAGKNYLVKHINLKPDVLKRITNLGIFAGAVVFVVKKAGKFSPILINCNGLNVAIGSDISKNIEATDYE